MLSQILTLVGLGLMLGVAVAFDAYDEGFAKNSMLPLSAAAYADDPTKCLSKIQPDVVVHKVYTVVCDKNNTCLAYTALNHVQNAIIVTFRGSKNNNQILQQAVDSLFGPRRSFYKLGSVGNYFGDAFQLLWGAGIQQDFLALRQQYPDYQVWVTGHSLGAALASLAAGAIASESEESREGLRLVTFGSPRVGDLWYAQGLEKLVPYSYRIVHAHDIIVQLPPISPLFYWHHRQEIYYPGNMTAGAPFKVCKKAEDYGCSNGQINTSMEDHRHYFEIRVPSYCADLLNATSVADF